MQGLVLYQIIYMLQATYIEQGVLLENIILYMETLTILIQEELYVWGAGHLVKGDKNYEK